MPKRKSSRVVSRDPLVPDATTLEEGKEMASENYISSRTRSQRARREKERELICETVKKSSDSTLEQQTGNNISSDNALSHARTDTEKDELHVEKKDHSSCEVKNTAEKTDTDKILDASTSSEQEKQTDVIVEISKVSEKNISSRVLVQCARRAREREFICKSVKNSKTTSDSALEQQSSNKTPSNGACSQETTGKFPSNGACSQETANKFPSNIASTHAQTDTKTDELLVDKGEIPSGSSNNHMEKDKSSVDPSQDHLVPVPTSLEQVSEKHVSSRVLAQRARRKRERELSCESVKKSKTTSSSSLGQQTGNNTPSNTACSQETFREFPSNIALTHVQTDIEKDELGKKKDHSNSEVKNTVEKTDMDKIIDVSTVNAKKLKRILSQRARREREKKELQLKKLSVSSSAVKNMVSCKETKQHLPFSPNSTARNGLSAVPAAPSPSHCRPHEQKPVTREQPTSVEPNQRPSSLNPLMSFTLRQPPVRVHHFITSRNQINMNRNPLQSFDTSSVLRHIRMVQGMRGMKKRYPETTASIFKMDMGKRRMDPLTKPENPPKDQICLQPGGGNLPVSTPQIHLTGKQSSLEHPTVSTFREKVFAAVRKSLTRRQISQRNRRERERAEATKRRPVRLSKASLAQRARRKREKEQAVMASSSTCPLPVEEQCNQEGSEKLVSQGSSLHIHPPNNGVSSELRSSIPAEHLTSAIYVNSPPPSSASQGSNLHSLPPNKGVSSELGSSKPEEHLTSAACANFPPQTSVLQGSNLHILPPNKVVSSVLGSSIPEEDVTSAVRVNPPPQSLVSQGTSRESERAEATRHSRPVLLSRASMAQRARRDKQRQLAAMASSSTCSLRVEEQSVGAATAMINSKCTVKASPTPTAGNSTQKQFQKMASQGSNLQILPPSKGVSSELGFSMPAVHPTSVFCVNSTPQSSVSQGSTLHILPPNKGTSSELGSSIPAEHFTSAVCVNSPPRSSVSQGCTLHILPPNKGVCSELGSSIPAKHLTSAVFVKSPPRSLAGGTTASSVRSGLRPDNLISHDASTPVNTYSLGKPGVMRLSSLSANVGFENAFDRGSKIGRVSNQSLSSTLLASSGTAYPSSSSHGPASASSDMTKTTIGTDRSSGTCRISQPWLSPLTNRALLPQLVKCCEMRGLTDSNNNGKKWRPAGNSFKGPKELSVGAAAVIISSKGSNASRTQAQGNSSLNRVQKKVSQGSYVQSFAANPARSLPGGPTASAVHSGRGPDHLTAGDASSLLNVSSLKKAELMRVSSPSANMRLEKGIDRNCKFGSVASQSQNKVNLCPGIAFPSPVGLASAASDMVKKTLGTDQSESGGSTQTLLSTRSNGILLPQLGGSCTATGVTDSNNDGKQWRPSGSSFKHPKEMVQQRIDSTLDVHGAARSDKCMTGHKEEEPKKKASNDLKTDNLNAVPSSPGNSILLEDTRTIADATMVSPVNLSINDRPQSPILNQNVHIENEHLVSTNKISEELHESNKKTDCAQQDHREQPSLLPKTQTDESNKDSLLPPMKSLTEPSSALNDRGNASGASYPGGFRKMDEEYWKARFLRLQDRLRRCDDTSDEEYIQRIQYSSLDVGGGHTLELKGRAMKLLLEEGYELMRVKHLNVLGNSVVPLTEPLETEN